MSGIASAPTTLPSMPIHLLGDPQSRALALASAQDDVLLTCQARELGLSDRELRALRRAGEIPVVRGAIAVPPVRDPVRATARALQPVVPQAVISHVTAARIHGLEGLGYWNPTDPVDATLQRAATRWQKAGARLHFLPLAEPAIVDVQGLRGTTPASMLLHRARVLERNAFVCISDSALQKRLLDPQARDELGRQPQGCGLRRAEQWLGLADAQSESPSETTIRLILVDAGLPPDFLQYDIWTDGGFHVARLDMGWIRSGKKKVGLEVAGFTTGFGRRTTTATSSTPCTAWLGHPAGHGVRRSSPARVRRSAGHAGARDGVSPGVFASW